MPDDTQPTASGRDLARQALNTYKAGRTPGSTAGPGRKKTGRIREDRAGGRDPIKLGGVLDRIGSEEAWKTSIDGGSIIDQWPTLCPQRYVDHLQPVAFDSELGRLDIRPDSPAYATELRMFGPMLAKQLNTELGRDVVRTIRILRVGTVTPVAATTPDDCFTAVKQSATPVRTRETASPGYRMALETALAHKPDRTRHLNPKTAAAIEGSTAALLDPVKREPEQAFTDAVAEAERLAELHARQHPDDPLLAAVQAALRYKHSGGSTPPVQRLFEAP